MEQFFTVEQAAGRLKLHAKTILRLIHDGRLRATRIGKSYRILQSDLDTFGGAPARPASPRPPRVTCMIDYPGLSAGASERLATVLNAAVTADAARPDPVHLSTAYDPQAETLKMVLIASPLDVAALLRTIHLVMEP